MGSSFTEVTAMFGKENGRLLLGGKWGIEREAQRVTPAGDLALTPHPAAFGNKLENPHVTTDFSESQIELVTPPFESVESAVDYLKNLQVTVESELENEMLWPLSMPPKLPGEDEIPVSRFDDTGDGREKGIYREGLALRYGKKMQMISGIHYNFSFGKEMLDHLYGQMGNGQDKRSFTDNLYFSMARNFLRNRWLLIYLFGASPNIDPTYYSVIEKELRIIFQCCPECCNPTVGIEKYATSLRVSRFGYSDSVQGKSSVSYDSLQQYINGIRRLMSIKSGKFSKLGLHKDGKQIQLNTNILQKESEFYSAIRLKQIAQKGETQLDALEKRGVGYAEVRIIDLDPFEKTGISLQQMRFLQLFMLYCLFEKSDPIRADELDRINRNHHLSAISGRRSNLQLYRYSKGTAAMKDWSKEVFEKIRIIASVMDGAGGDGRYLDCVGKEYAKILDRSLVPSALIQKEMKERSETFLDYGVRKAAEHRGLTGLKTNAGHEISGSNRVNGMSGSVLRPADETRYGDYIYMEG
jgi:glutamate--cysteine ligase